MSAGQQIGLIGSSVRVQSLPTASAATFGEGNRFYTLIGQQDGYITGHTYRTVMANDVYSWEDVRNELMLLALVDGTITANSSIEVELSNFNRLPLVDNLLIVYSTASQYALMKVSAVTSTAATLIVKDNSAANIVSTKGETGAAGVGITNATAGESIVADGKTTTPITFSFSDGTTKEFDVEAQNGIDGAQGVGVKSITSGIPTVVNDKTNTPILITLTDNTKVDLVVSAENGKDGTSATVDIVQATGQSTTSVMSQKAVTDELNKKANTSDIPTKTSQLTNDSNYATKPYVDTQDNKKLDKAGGSITGNLTIGGNLIVNGATTSIDSTTLKVSDKLIEVAHGNTTTLTTPAGLVAPKYDGTNSGALVFDSTGTAYVGDVTLDSAGNIDVSNSELQPLATRTGLVGGNLVQYDSSALTLKDSGKKISDLATTSQVNAKYTKPSGGIPKTDLASDVQTSLGKANSALQANDISGKANLAGGNTFSGNQVITGYLDIRGTATEKHLKTRGIGGSDGNGNSSDLYLQYSSDYKTYFGKTGQSTLNADGSISINGKTAATTDQIPAAANNGTLTIQKNGTKVQTFTANQSTNVTANITVPTKVSELTNDSEFITANDAVKSVVDYNDTSKNIKIGYSGAGITGGDIKYIAGYTVSDGTTGNVARIKDISKDALKSWLGYATVATSGSYNDLLDKPNIPTVNNGTLTIQKNGTTVATFSANQSGNATANITVPTFSLSGTTLYITL